MEIAHSTVTDIAVGKIVYSILVGANVAKAIYLTVFDATVAEISI